MRFITIRKRDLRIMNLTLSPRRQSDVVVAFLIKFRCLLGKFEHLKVQIPPFHGMSFTHRNAKG